jgi:hypothetical protein
VRGACAAAVALLPVVKASLRSRSESVTFATLERCVRCCCCCVSHGRVCVWGGSGPLRRLMKTFSCGCTTYLPKTGTLRLHG